MRVLRLDQVHVSRHALAIRASVGDLSFSTSYWYQDVDFDQLAAQTSAEAVARLGFHVALFEINKLCSLRPDRLELGEYARFWTADLADLWSTVLAKVWAQWRYENDDPDYRGPEVAHPFASPEAPLDGIRAADAPILALCGGGKDSLVTMRLLERAGLEYDSLVYSSSIYGRAEPQHALAGALVDRCRPRKRLRQWIYDDFLDSPVLTLHPELDVRTLTAAETPSSIFAALPIALAHGHQAVCLGHERSADVGQVRWAATGEDVNHQWGKSLAAQRMIDRYIQESLVTGVRCMSPLKPIYDPLIFAALQHSLDDVPFTHSCNLAKPWCLACPKCAYVWLGYAAFLPPEVVHATFGDANLLDRAELLPMFRALLGLDGGGQPFECIGSADEVGLYLALCRARGYTGAALDLAEASSEVERWSEYLAVVFEDGAMPEPIRERIEPELRELATRAQGYLEQVLAPLA